jgi:hypothetical protein
VKYLNIFIHTFGIPVLLPLKDPATSDILEQYLMMDQTNSQMEDDFHAYLGNRYYLSD